MRRDAASDDEGKRLDARDLKRFPDMVSDIVNEGNSPTNHRVVSIYKNYLVVWIGYLNTKEQEMWSNVYRYNIDDDTYDLMVSYYSVMDSNWPELVDEKLIVDNAYGVMHIYNIETMEKIFEKTDEKIHTHAVHGEDIYYFKYRNPEENADGIPLYIKRIGEKEERILCRLPISGYVKVLKGYIYVMTYVNSEAVVYKVKLDGTGMKESSVYEANFRYFYLEDGWHLRR